MLEVNIIDFQKLKEEDVFRTKEGKLYRKALKLAVDAGAISSLVLQKKLGAKEKIIAFSSRELIICGDLTVKKTITILPDR